MIGCLRTRVRKQPIIVLYFESETVRKFYNLEACSFFTGRRISMLFDRTGSGSLLAPLEECSCDEKCKYSESKEEVAQCLQQPDSSHCVSTDFSKVHHPKPLITRHSSNDMDPVRKYIPKERFRQIRRNSEPEKNLFDCLHKSSKQRDNVNAKCIQPKGLVPIQRRNSLNSGKTNDECKTATQRKLLCSKDESGIHAIKATHFVGSSSVHNRHRRLSAPTVPRHHLPTLKQSTILTSQPLLEQPSSKTVTRSKTMQRRVSFPSILAETSSHDENGLQEDSATFLISRCGVQKPTSNSKLCKRKASNNRRISLPDIPSGRSIYEDVSTEMSTEASSIIHTNSRNCTSGRRSGDNQSNFHSSTCIHSENNTLINTAETSNLVQTCRHASQRRLSEPAYNMKTLYETRVPVQNEESRMGIDIHKWLESLGSDCDENLEPTETTHTENEFEEDISEMHESDDDNHRSVSQLTGVYSNISDEFEKFSPNILTTDGSVDKDALIRDIVGDLNGTVLQINANSTSIPSSQYTSRNIDPSMVASNKRRHSTGTRDNCFTQTKLLMPKACWCFRCQIMNAMYYNGDENLDNWGNYPCFRR